MHKKGSRTLSSSKGFAHLILLLVVGVVLVGGYVLYKQGYIQLHPNQDNSIVPPTTESSNKISQQPTISSDETANWKTYTNTKVGFSFKYPPDWNLIFHPEAWDYLESPNFVQDPNEHVESEAQQGASLGIINPPIGYPLKDIVEGAVLGGGDVSDARKISNVKSILIDGNEGVEFDFQGVNNKGIMGTRVQFNAKGKTYSLEMIYASKDYKKTLDQILSTFKFTDTANWKTYTNSIYKFSFQYPSDVIVKAYDPKRITVYKPSSNNTIQFSFDIFVRENPDHLSETAFYAKSANTKLEEGLPHYNVAKVTLGNKQVVRIVADKAFYSQSSLPYTNYFYSTTGNYIEIITSEYEGKYTGTSTEIIATNVDKTVSQILATFKFTN